MTEKIFRILLTVAALTLPQIIKTSAAAAQSISIGAMEKTPHMSPARKPAKKDRSSYDEEEFERRKPHLNPEQGKKALLSGEDIHGSYIPESASFTPDRDIFRKKETTGNINEDLSTPPHRTWRKANRIFTTLSFDTFSDDHLVLNFSIYESDYNIAVTKYGYRQMELDSLCSTFRSSLDDKDKTLQMSTKNPGMPFQLPEACLPKAQSFFAQRGMNLDPVSRTLSWDLPVIAQREKNNVRTLADDLRKKAAEHNYGKREIAGAVLSMVQSAISYEIPPIKTNTGRQFFNGLYTPVQTIVEGRGDCDTKSLLMAAVLSHWPSIRVIGIQVPEHYFLGIAVPVMDGDETLTYRGTKYVLTEPAGPARLPPGRIGGLSRKYINKDYKVQEFF